MKKLLLASVAITGLAFAAPAHADVDLEVGGYFKGYGAFIDQDEPNDGTLKADVAGFDMVRETEIHIGGETTLDNGLTVGAHFEFQADGNDNMASDESYVYFSGDWGRFNVGAENGAGYLLQVAAPSADSNVDGIVQYVSPFVAAVDLDGSTIIETDELGLGAGALSYAMSTGKMDKITYLSPVMSGFQAGLSFTPDASGNSDSFGIDTDEDDDGVLGEIYELAVRYEGDFENVGVIAGAGYALGIEEGSSPTTDDVESWNVGLDLDIAAFGIGAIYMEDNQGLAGVGSGDLETMVVGADYTTGPFKLGVSYYNAEDKAFDVEFDRYTAGVIYEYGPGMSFRGSVQMLEQDNPTGIDDADGTAVLLGTDITF